ncbi:uncharacterized protein [Cherax quadricarinatus]|uniref:uncharacterized protein isoform X2 n=1 Tax=Cherax quadricarinatus TaxID=27406 RepID=UPI00387E50AC
MATRLPFSSQSILYVLLDYVDEDNRCDVEIIQKALECTVVLAAGVVGGTRLPGVGVGVLGPPFTRLLRLSPVRNNLPGLVSSLGRMLDHLTPAQRGTEMNLEVSEALDAVVEEAATFLPASSHPLQVAGVESVLEGSQQQLQQLPGGDAVRGVWITAATYTPDPYTFTALFKSWLGETKGKDPHVHVTFPASSSDQDTLTLLTDIQEVMLDPVCLPSAISSRLTIHHNLLRTVSTTQGSTVTVVELQVVKRVKCATLATVVFGHSYYLLPTGATSLPFNDIWENRQYVRAVAQQLLSRDEALLARATGPVGSITPMVAILPAPHCSALSLVHVAPAELLLAERHLDTHHLDVPDKVSREMEERLTSLEVSDVKLVDLTSSLIPTLIQHFTKTPRGGGGRLGQVNNTSMTQVGNSVCGNTRALPQHPAFTTSFDPDAEVVTTRGRTTETRPRGFSGRRGGRGHRWSTASLY